VLSVINSLLGHTSEGQMFDVLQPSVALIATFYPRGGLLYHFRNGSNAAV
jgi:hypothetical protein